MLNLFILYNVSVCLFDEVIVILIFRLESICWLIFILIVLLFIISICLFKRCLVCYFWFLRFFSVCLLSDSWVGDSVEISFVLVNGSLMIFIFWIRVFFICFCMFCLLRGLINVVRFSDWYLLNCMCLMKLF